MNYDEIARQVLVRTLSSRCPCHECHHVRVSRSPHAQAVLLQRRDEAIKAALVELREDAVPN